MNEKCRKEVVKSVGYNGRKQNVVTWSEVTYNCGMLTVSVLQFCFSILVILLNFLSKTSHNNRTIIYKISLH